MKNLLLSNQEYRDILDYYNIDYTRLTSAELKQKAQQVIAYKLCKCIKKVTNNNKFKTEQPAIAICTNSILKSRNLKYYGFNCLKTPKLLPFGSKSKELDKYPKQGNNVGLIKQRTGEINIDKSKKSINKTKTMRKKRPSNKGKSKRKNSGNRKTNNTRKIHRNAKK